VPTLTIEEFCKDYGLDEAIRHCLERQKFKTAGALLEMTKSDFGKVGLDMGEIAELRSALKSFLQTGEKVVPG